LLQLNLQLFDSLLQSQAFRLCFGVVLRSIVEFFFDCGMTDASQFPLFAGSRFEAAAKLGPVLLLTQHLFADGITLSASLFGLSQHGSVQFTRVGSDSVD